MKKFYTVIFTLTLLFSPQQKIRADLGDVLAGLCVAGLGAAAIGTIGTIVYNAIKPLSDNEEIERAETLYSDSQSLYSKYLVRYENVFYSSISQLVLEIIRSSHYEEFIFLSYKLKLDDAIWNLKNKINSVEKKKNHLINRMHKLSENNKLSWYEVENYKKQYDYLCQKLIQIKTLLQELKLNLKNIRARVVILPEYLQDVKNEYIQQQVLEPEYNVEVVINETNHHCCPHTNEYIEYSYCPYCDEYCTCEDCYQDEENEYDDNYDMYEVDPYEEDEHENYYDMYKDNAYNVSYHEYDNYNEENDKDYYIDYIESFS